MAHHDEAVWGDPWEYRPERFLDENGKLLPADSDLMKRWVKSEHCRAHKQWHTYSRENGQYGESWINHSAVVLHVWLQRKSQKHVWDTDSTFLVPMSSDGNGVPLELEHLILIFDKRKKTAFHCVYFLFEKKYEPAKYTGLVEKSAVIGPFEDKNSFFIWLDTPWQRYFIPPILFS